MSPKSLFNVILKVLGLFFLRDFLISLPSFLSLVSMMLNFSEREPLSALVGGFIVIGLYGYIAYALLFRTNWIIGKLRLAAGFEVDELSFNMHRSSVLSIAIIIIGAMMIINTVPNFLRQMFLVFQAQKNSVLNYYPKPDTTLIVVYVAEIIIGLLVLGNVRKIVSYIELKRRSAVINESEDHLDKQEG